MEKYFKNFEQSRFYIPARHGIPLRKPRTYRPHLFFCLTFLSVSVPQTPSPR